MHTTFTCTSCQRTIAAQVPPGSRVQCPLCQQVVTVPQVDAGSPVRLSLNGQPGTPRGGDTFDPNQPIYGPPPVPANLGYGVPSVAANSGLAVASLVCGIVGILGLCVWGLGAIVGLVALGLGIGAVVQIRRHPQRMGGRGLAIAGIVLGSLSIIIVPVVIFFFAIPMVSKFHAQANLAMCQAQLHSLSFALDNYAAQDSNGMYPDDITRLYAGNSFASYQMMCPADTTGGQSYYYVPGYSRASPGNQVLAYEHPDIHKAENGGHVLYKNGSVVFEKGSTFQQTISSIKTPKGKRFAPHKP
ncbi:MAG: DUF4190 domain-containing protein [Planctomycetes bacterium]|nr:DUF4190 domain-containing protein [Planctomycetota bacterium]